MNILKRLLRKLAIIFLLKWVGGKAPEVKEYLETVFSILEEL